MAKMSRETSRGNAPVALVCRLFRVSRQGYYAALRGGADLPRTKAETSTRAVSSRYASEEILLPAIRRICKEHPAWGVRKVWAVLRRYDGLMVSKNRVYALMKREGLTFEGKGGRPVLRGSVAVALPNRLWATDMTTIYTQRDGWVGVTPTIDCGCRSILGLAVSVSQEATTLLSSLRHALENELGEVAAVPDGLEWRTDHGPQFTGVDARDLCEAWELDHTFAPIGRPTGNAVAERVIRTLKEEVLWLRDFDTADEVRDAVEAWRRIYNERRPHQALGYRTPAEVRREHLGPSTAVAA